MDNYALPMSPFVMTVSRMAVVSTIALSAFWAMAADIESAKDAYRRGDNVLAAQRYTELAKQGNPEAQFLLAMMYDRGQGIERDYLEAIKWYGAAADQGYARAQRNLAVMYARGHGVTRDTDRAIQLFKEASAQGDDWAATFLGLIYAAGDGVPQDDEEAVKWYRLAADRSNWRAQFVVGVFYARGEGVPQDDVQAYKWFNLAGLSGVKEALEARELVAERMTREQIIEAHRLTREWQAAKPR